MPAVLETPQTPAHPVSKEPPSETQKLRRSGRSNWVKWWKVVLEVDIQQSQAKGSLSDVDCFNFSSNDHPGDFILKS